MRQWSQAARFCGTGLLLAFAWLINGARGQCCFVVNSPSKLWIYNAASAHLTVPQSAIVNTSLPLEQNVLQTWIPADQKPWDHNQRAYNQAREHVINVSNEPRGGQQNQSIYPVVTSGQTVGQGPVNSDSWQQSWSSNPAQQNRFFYTTPQPHVSSPDNTGPRQYDVGHVPFTDQFVTPGAHYNSANSQYQQNTPVPVFISVSSNPPDAAGPPRSPSSPHVIPTYNQPHQNMNPMNAEPRQPIEGGYYSGGPLIQNEAPNAQNVANSHSQMHYNQPSESYQIPNDPANGPLSAAIQNNRPQNYNNPSIGYGQQNPLFDGQQGSFESGSRPVNDNAGGSQGQLNAPSANRLQNAPEMYNSPSVQYPSNSALSEHAEEYPNQNNGYHGASPLYVPAVVGSSRNMDTAAGQQLVQNYVPGQPQIQNQNAQGSYNKDHSGYNINEGYAGSSTSQHEGPSSSSSPRTSEDSSIHQQTTVSSGIESQTIQYPPADETLPTSTEKTVHSETADQTLYGHTSEMPVLHPGYDGYPYTNSPPSPDSTFSSPSLPSVTSSSIHQTPSTVASTTVNENPTSGHSSVETTTPTSMTQTVQDSRSESSGTRSSSESPPPDGNNFLYPYTSEGRYNPNVPSRDQPQGGSSISDDLPVENSAYTETAVYGVAILAFVASFI